MVVVNKNDVFLTIRKHPELRNNVITHKIIIANDDKKIKYIEHCDSVYKLGNMDENDYNEIIDTFRNLKQSDYVTSLTVADVLMEINGTLDNITEIINSYIKCKRFSCYIIHAKARKNVNPNTSGNRSIVYYGTIFSNKQTKDTVRKILNNIYNAGFNWYVYVSVDRRIISRAVERLNEKITNATEAINYGDLDRINMLKDMERTWNEILMEKESASYNKMLIDLDSNDIDDYNKMINLANNTDKTHYIAIHKTRNGYHFVVDSENEEIFKNKFNKLINDYKIKASIQLNRYLYTCVINGNDLSFIHLADKIQ